MSAGGDPASLKDIDALLWSTVNADAFVQHVDSYLQLVQDEKDAVLENTFQSRRMHSPPHLPHSICASGALNKEMVSHIHLWMQSNFSRMLALPDLNDVSSGLHTAAVIQPQAMPLTDSSFSKPSAGSTILNDKLRRMISSESIGFSSSGSSSAFSSSVPISVPLVKKKSCATKSTNVPSSSGMTPGSHVLSRNIIIRNAIFFYASHVLHTCGDSHNLKQNSRTEAISDHVLPVSWEEVLQIVCKAVSVCNTRPMTLDPSVDNRSAGQVSSLSMLALTTAESHTLLLHLSDFLLPLLRCGGKDFVQMLLRSPALRQWQHRGVLQDDLDSNSFDAAQTQNRLQSFMAENYVKPFAEEDNRLEQKTKVEKDLYKLRGDAHDQFFNLFQQFRNIQSAVHSKPSELNRFFENDFVESTNNIMKLDPRNLPWFARIFLGLYIRQSLLPHETRPTHLQQTIPQSKDKEKMSRLEERLSGTAESKTPIDGMNSTQRSDRKDSAWNTQKIVSASQTPDNKNQFTPIRSKSSMSGSTRSKSKSANPTLSCESKSALEPEMIPKAFEFEESLQFFSRFIIRTNNHHFVQALVSAVLCEIAHYSQSSAQEDRSTGSDGDQLGASSKSRWEGNSFTISLVVLRSLGRMLGLLHWYPLYTSWTQSSVSPMTMEFAYSGLALPLLESFTHSVKHGKLALTVPWICAYLSMLSPHLEQLSSKEMSKFTLPHVYCGQYNIFRVLMSASRLRDLSVTGEGFSSNRLFVLMEIEALWRKIPIVRDSLISGIVPTESFLACIPLTSSQEQRILHCHSVGESLDAQQYALSDMALKILHPSLYNLIKDANDRLDVSARKAAATERIIKDNKKVVGALGAEKGVVAPSQSTSLDSSTNPVLAAKKIKKRQEATLIALLPTSSAAVPQATTSVDKPRSPSPLQLIPASPVSTSTKCSAKTMTSAKKVPRTPHLQTSSLESSHLQVNGATNNLTSSIEKLRQRRLKSPFRPNGVSQLEGSLNNQHQVSRRLFSEEGVDELDHGLADYGATDVVTKLEDAFWNSHKELCEVHTFVLFVMRSIGRDRVTDIVCEGIHTLSYELDKVNEKDYQDVTDGHLNSLCALGGNRIKELFSVAKNILARRLYSLMISSRHSQRAARLAFTKTMQSLSHHQEMVLLHLREYAHRKLKEVRESKGRRLKIMGPSMATSSGLPFAEVEICSQEKVVTDRTRLEIDRLLGCLALHKMVLLSTSTAIDSSSLSFSVKQSLDQGRDLTSLVAIIQSVITVVANLDVCCPQSQSGTSLNGKEISCHSKLTDWFWLNPLACVHQLLASLLILLTNPNNWGVNNADDKDCAITVVHLFILQSVPYLISIDLQCLSRNEKKPRESLTLSFVADLIRSRWLTSDGLARIVQSVTRDKSASFYANCRGLRNLTASSLQQGFLLLFQCLAVDKDASISLINIDIDMVRSACNEWLGTRSAQLLNDCLANTSQSQTALISI